MMARSRRRTRAAKKTFNWRIWVASLLFLVSAILFSIGPITTFLLHQMNNGAPVQVSAQEIEQNQSAEATFDFASVESIDLALVLQNQNRSINLPVLGYIAVPTVNLNLPIYKGVGNTALLYGAGTMKETQVMGEGNYALAGHHYPASKTVLFSPLMNLKEGDPIYVTDLQYVYEYKTKSIEIVDPTAVYVIDDRPGETEITLITCNDDTTKRYVFKGDLVSKTAIGMVNENVKNAFNIELTAP